MTFKQRFASISFSSPTDAQMQRLFRLYVEDKEVAGTA